MTTIRDALVTELEEGQELDASTQSGVINSSKSQFLRFMRTEANTESIFSIYISNYILNSVSVLGGLHNRYYIGRFHFLRTSFRVISFFLPVAVTTFYNFQFPLIRN